MSVVEIPVTAPVEQLTEREQRARTLEAAALEIEVRGHSKKRAMDRSGAVCLYGALGCARGWNGPARVLIPYEDYLPDWAGFFPGGHGGAWKVADWNNAPERKPEEVTFLLRWRAEEIRDGWDA